MSIVAYGAASCSVRAVRTTNLGVCGGLSYPGGSLSVEEPERDSTREPELGSFAASASVTAGDTERDAERDTGTLYSTELSSVIVDAMVFSVRVMSVLSSSRRAVLISSPLSFAKIISFIFNSVCLILAD